MDPRDPYINMEMFIYGRPIWDFKIFQLWHSEIYCLIWLTIRNQNKHRCIISTVLPIPEDIKSSHESLWLSLSLENSSLL